MKNLLMAVLFAATTLTGFKTCAGNGLNKPIAEVKIFVFVHGAWQAAYAWKFVKEQLEKKGQKVIVVELPGHGDDTTPPNAVSLNLYRDKVIEAINGTSGKVILVGHSFGGMTISAVAEQIPDRIEKMVYIGAFLPANGQYALGMVANNKTSLLGPSLIPSADQLTMDLKHENIIAIFCADASPAVQKLVLANYRPEAAIPFTNPVSLTDANFGKVDKYYVHTLLDRNLGMDFQKQMVAASGIKKIYSLNSAHCPFLTMPGQVTALLMKISK
jgi:pimeloyl-ACP methyl ester carboxylesterase